MKGIIALLTVLQLFWLSGCATAVSGSMTAREMAGQLETFSLETPFDEMVQHFSALTNKQSNKLEVAGISVHAYLLVNPCHEGFSSLTMYRQWPKGILLELSYDDLVFHPAVADNTLQAGEVLVFLDSTKRFKGYLAYSSGRFSADKERLKVEKNTFRTLGLVEESKRAKESIELIKRGGEAIKRLPKLPLKNNRAKDEN